MPPGYHLKERIMKHGKQHADGSRSGGQPEYGPPIPVNGKRPDWLDDMERCIVEYRADSEMVSPRDGKFHAYAQARYWPDVINVQAKSDHPYYQSAEYKASAEQAAHDANPFTRENMEKASEVERAIALLEATGHTVTPPDPLAGLSDIPDVVIPVWALDKATNMAGWDCWTAVPSDDERLCDSFTAHAETICKHEAAPDPLAAEREFLAGLEDASDITLCDGSVWRSGANDKYVTVAMEYLRANKERL